VPEQFRIILIALNQNVATGFLNALQFAGEVNRFLPTGNRPGGFITDVADAEQFTFGRLKNFWRVAEMFKQQPRAHRADVFDEIEGDKRLPRVHAIWITVVKKRRKSAFGMVAIRRLFAT
jgi:hypothetical protein